MTWLTSASSPKYPVIINGREVMLTAGELDTLIKKKLKQLICIQRLFEQFEVSMDRLDNLSIIVVPLDKKYAETDGSTMKLNETLFDGGKFFEEYFFVVCHELVHYLSRAKEEDSYFHDPEEVLGFCTSIAYEIENGSDFDEIWNKIYNKIAFHFNNEENSREFFQNMFIKAKNLLN